MRLRGKRASVASRRLVEGAFFIKFPNASISKSAFLLDQVGPDMAEDDFHFYEHGKMALVVGYPDAQSLALLDEDSFIPKRGFQHYGAVISGGKAQKFLLHDLDDERPVLLRV